MVTFDAELYLRLLGERLLQDREQQRHHHRSPLDGPAAALVAAGTIGPALARRVVDDYAAALRVRAGERGFPHFGPPARRRRPGRLPARQTTILDHELPFGPGLLLLRDLAIDEKGATLRYRWRRDAPGPSRGASRMIGGPGGFPWGAAAPAITDDRGNRLTVRSRSGSGSDDHWDGKLALDGAIAPNTSWLEVEGIRVDLDRRTAPCEVRIEPLDDQNPIARFLWRRLAAPELPFGRTTDLEPALEALQAAGVLQSAEPLVRDVRAVADRMPAHHHHRHHQSGGRGRGLPEPWRSLLRRMARDDGPALSLVIGALTPPFDGMQVVAHSVISDSQGFDVEFEVAPNVLHANALDELPVAWWARDDRGNHYLGTPNGWSGSDEHAEGNLRFWPALDPRANRLELIVCGDRHRAVVTISLTADPERTR